MKKRWRRRGIWLICSVLLTFGLLEGAIRWWLVTETPADGEIVFLSAYRLPPRQLPVERTRVLIDDYLSRPDAHIRYDSRLGWTFRPLSTSENGLYTTNATGLRADREYSLTPPEGVLRIAVFGDSFTHGDEVRLTESWPYLLDEQLPGVEVLNFGVSAYGLDQAYLRWHDVGRRYQPDIVIVGLVDVDIFRTVNLIRLLAVNRTGIPFSKPRFVLSENGELELINSPTILPEFMPDAVRTFPDSPLAAYEYFYRPAGYTDHWYLHSRLIAVLLTLRESHRADGINALREPEADCTQYPAVEALLDPSGEAGQITLAILETWAQEVEAQGGQFVIVHLPRFHEVKTFQHKGRLPCPALFDVIEARYPVIEGADYFEALTPDAYFISRWHYSPEGHRVIASGLAGIRWQQRSRSAVQ